MEEDSLNSFIMNEQQIPSDSLEKVSAPHDGSPVQNRPKLKKIKRPKIRPSTDIPPAPSKVSPIESTLDTLENLESSSSELDNGNSFTNTDETLDDASFVQSTSTNIAKISDVQDIATASDNSYLSEGLPPELDYITDENLDVEFEADMSDYVRKNIMYIAAGVCLFIGLIIGKALFATQTIEKHGLEGVVTNPDVPNGRPRCGLTDKSQACVFYIMNWYKQELNGRDFYKLAAQLTGREEYMIETHNLLYATVKIKPGNFAQLNIPALK